MNNQLLLRKITWVQASKKTKEKTVCSKALDKNQKSDSKFQFGQLVRTAEIKNDFSKGDNTNWHFRLYAITEINHVTIHSYRTDFLPERFIEIFLTATKNFRSNQSSYEKTKCFWTK